MPASTDSPTGPVTPNASAVVEEEGGVGRVTPRGGAPRAPVGPSVYRRRPHPAPDPDGRTHRIPDRVRPLEGETPRGPGSVIVTTGPDHVDGVPDRPRTRAPRYRVPGGPPPARVDPVAGPPVTRDPLPFRDLPRTTGPRRRCRPRPATGPSTVPRTTPSRPTRPPRSTTPATITTSGPTATVRGPDRGGCTRP